MTRFRDWWWNEFDTGADDAVFDAGSPEAASELFPILRGLAWPDFEVRAEGPTLNLRRMAEKHYPRRNDAPLVCGTRRAF